MWLLSLPDTDARVRLSLLYKGCEREGGGGWRRGRRNEVGRGRGGRGVIRIGEGWERKGGGLPSLRITSN